MVSSSQVTKTEIIAHKMSFGVLSVTIIFVNLEKSHPVLVLFGIYPHLQGKWTVKAQHTIGNIGIGKPHHTVTVIIKQLTTVKLWA